MLWRFYQRYDRLGEPGRFLLFMAVLIPVLIAATNPYSTAVSAVGWVALLLLLATRAWYHCVRPRLKKSDAADRAER